MGVINTSKTWILITSWIILSTLLAWCWPQTGNNEKVSWWTNIQEWKTMWSKIASNVDGKLQNNKENNQFSAEEKSIKKLENKKIQSNSNAKKIQNNITSNTNVWNDNYKDVVDTIDPNSMVNNWQWNWDIKEEHTKQEEINIKPGDSKEYNPVTDTVHNSNNTMDNMPNYKTMWTNDLQNYALMFVNNYISDGGETIKLKEWINIDKMKVLPQIKFMYNKLCKTQTDNNYIVCNKLHAMYELINK